MAGYLVKKGGLFSSQFWRSSNILPVSIQLLITVRGKFISQWRSRHKKRVHVKNHILLKSVQSCLHKWALATGRKTQTTLKVPSISQHCYLGAKPQHSTQVIVETKSSNHSSIQPLGTFHVFNVQTSSTFYEVIGKEMNKLTAVRTLELYDCMQWFY